MSLLTLSDFGVTFGSRSVLQSINLAVAEKGITTVMGPVASGKSTLLRSLAGINAASPSFSRTGQAVYLGEDLGQHDWPALVGQKSRLLMASVRENLVCELPERHQLSFLQQQDLARRLLSGAGVDHYFFDLEQAVVSLELGLQRLIAIIRTLATPTPMVMLDEPTADINDTFSEKILDILRHEAEKRALLIVTHNQRHARALDGDTLLLAGGTIQEHQTTTKFFSTPISPVTATFVQTGSCTLPHGNTETQTRRIRTQQPIQDNDFSYVSDTLGPRQFLWLKPGLLAGTSKPGLIHDLEYDLAAIQRMGIKHLVTLTEQPFNCPVLEKYGLSNYWFPIDDMGCPEIEPAVRLCGQIADFLSTESPVALHCHAGLGRTGTMLATYLIFEGAEALDALEQVRRIEPRWVQSEIQVTFLEQFARAYKNLC